MISLLKCDIEGSVARLTIADETGQERLDESDRESSVGLDGSDFSDDE